MSIEEIQKLAKNIEEQRTQMIAPLIEIRKTMRPFIEAQKSFDHLKTMNPLSGYKSPIKTLGIGPLLDIQFKISIVKLDFPIRNIINETLSPLFELLKTVDFDNLRFSIAKAAFKDRNELIELFYQSDIFPPIWFLDAENIFETNSEFTPEKLLKSEVLKDFYLGQIEKWKLNYTEDSSAIFINEIKDNYERDNYISVSVLIFVLLESLYSKTILINMDEKRKRYEKIRRALKEKVFQKVGIISLYDKFIAENLYSDTDNAKKYSRHALHGKYEMFSQLSALNAIFIYDFLHFLLFSATTEKSDNS